MSPSARVQSVEAIKDFRVVLWKFAQVVSTSTGEALSEVRRTLNWLDHEAPSYWQGQVRRRRAAVEQAEAAVRKQRLYRDIDGSRKSAVEQFQVLAAAKRRLEQAQEKLQRVKHWRRQLEAELENLQPALQRGAHIAEQIVPAAVAHLDELIVALQSYLAAAPAARRSAGEPMDIVTETMARPVPEEAELSAHPTPPDHPTHPDHPDYPDHPDHPVNRKARDEPNREDES